ncbi:terminase large subunit [Granulicella tundricola]|uniref:Terminase n=1 Tax=Granulicella tundricola (strain ATCC BAA-1859 / DSM 23138 / MP5ACTX9) TaxID=1198114 RepID=E8X0Q3_GRATM|nr:terminase TerL endonuclease subunit [Granulicella tundricola]ADW69004.1 Terminase [Granulicella tundricola MP5ACTX9]
MTDYAALAHQYAQDVVTGKILACRWIRLACQRHLFDLDRIQSSEYLYKFSALKANKVCAFAEMLPLGGRFAAKGKNLKLQPWQCFLLACTFGWVHKTNGLRRFRTVYLYVPRKNGKSFLSAVIGLWMLMFDGEQQAEVYCGATTLPQAEYVFKPAQQIIRKCAGLQTFGAKNLASAIVFPASESRMSAVIGQPPDGSSPSCALLDEAHEWSNDILMSTMQTGMGARLQPLTLVTTTAGYNTAGPAKLMQDELQDVLEGIKEDDQLFGLIYGLDDKDDWKEPSSLVKANPNIGVSVGLEYLQSQLHKAIQTPRLQTATKTKHLNIWCASAVGWIDMDRWSRCKDENLSIENFKGETCWAGIDLANKIDLTAYVLLFRRVLNGIPHFYLFPRFYLPAAKIDDPANGHYRQWEGNGYLQSVPGEVNTFEELHEQIKKDRELYDVAEWAFDPAHAHLFVAKLLEEKLPLVEVPQTWKFQSEPMKELEALVLQEQLHHDGNPVMTWCIANTTVKYLNGDVIRPDRASYEKKKDGTDATLMALGRAQVAKPKKTAWAVEVW